VEDMFPEEDICKEDKEEEEGQEIYVKLSVTLATKRGI